MKPEPKQGRGVLGGRVDMRPRGFTDPQPRPLTADQLIGDPAIAMDTRGRLIIDDKELRARLAVWPIGSVFISTVATDPAASLGFGRWSAIGAGRALVGVDAGDHDFATAGKVGGSKPVAVDAALTGSGSRVLTSPAGQSMPPFVAVHLWKRTA